MSAGLPLSLTNTGSVCITDPPYNADPTGANTSPIPWASAISAITNGLLIVPPGNFVINYTPSGVLFTPNAGLTIRGAGKNVSVLTFSAQSAAASILFAQANGQLIFQDISIRITQFPGQQTSIAAFESSGLELRDAEINGGMTNTGTTLNSTPVLFAFASSGTQTDCAPSGPTLKTSITRFLKPTHPRRSIIALPYTIITLLAFTAKMPASIPHWGLALKFQ